MSERKPVDGDWEYEGRYALVGCVLMLLPIVALIFWVAYTKQP